jgi:dTDP-4-dehydrorhamnose 3,5-epimerase-like enzyme
MIDSFETTSLAVDGCYTYRATRRVPTASRPDIIEYFNVTKNHTDPAMQQVNVTTSVLNVIRGVHVSAFPKVVFCPVGRIYDVVVDLRPDSPTFKQWTGAWLDRDTHIICPGFCAHGVFAAEEGSVICYYQGGTFFNHLDYAVSAQDPALGIEWPSASAYVMSEKDLSSPNADAPLIAKIKARIDNPIEDIHTETNSDVVIVAANSDRGAGIAARLQDKRVHLVEGSAVNRESLNAAIFSLRPKDGVIYVVGESGGRAASLITVEILNIVHICANQKHQLVIVAEGGRREVGFAIRSVIAGNRKNDVGVVVADVGQSAEFAVQLLNEKKGGIYRLPNTVDLLSQPPVKTETGIDTAALSALFGRPSAE